jgi:drug/metabolite transporter (DMT)-like permease
MSKWAMFASFALLIAVDTFVQIAFKFAGENTLPVTFDVAWLQRVAAEPWLVGVAIGGVAAFLTYMSLIRYAPIGPAFAASHLDIVSITLFSVWYFGDRLSLMQVLGCGAIVLGVLVLAYGETRS